MAVSQLTADPLGILRAGPALQLAVAVLVFLRQRHPEVALLAAGSRQR